jgi:sulfur relay (sulfurtransferase) DsrC/TusE family protein
MGPMRNDGQKKLIERSFLEAARRASAVIPDGEIEDFEGPDFKIDTAAGSLGVEVTEVLRAGEGPFRPVAEENFHQEVIRIARDEYCSTAGATPVRVLVYSWNAEGGRRDKRKMARALVEFVKTHPAGTFSRLAKLPEGFGTIHIDSIGDGWTSGETGGPTIPEIYEQLASAISAKNALLPRYRARFPHSPIWLLVYSGFAVSRGLPIPYGTSERTFPFDFEKVLFFSCLSPEVVEIQRNKNS